MVSVVGWFDDSKGVGGAVTASVIEGFGLRFSGTTICESDKVMKSSEIVVEGKEVST